MEKTVRARSRKDAGRLLEEFEKRFFQKRIEKLSKLIESNPRWPDLYRQRGALKAAAGDTAGALEDFDTGLKIATDVEILSEKTALLEREGRLEEALECVDRLIRAVGIRGESWMQKALILIGLDKNVEALDCLRMAYRLGYRVPSLIQLVEEEAEKARAQEKRGR